jgi:hypothetical protein
MRSNFIQTYNDLRNSHTDQALSKPDSERRIFSTNFGPQQTNILDKK